jgi:hypothetical protein
MLTPLVDDQASSVGISRFPNKLKFDQFVPLVLSRIGASKFPL